MLAIEFEQLSALGLTPALANRRRTGHPDGRDLNCCALPWFIAARSGVHDGR
jgi:hypothetical protein